ncbi:MAG TPA: hypothetical protein VGW38_13110 [Chloroflexota bacterium]|nr:hypothetical protein [Chloroflexota bacterium]
MPHLRAVRRGRCEERADKRDASRRRTYRTVALATERRELAFGAPWPRVRGSVRH